MKADEAKTLTKKAFEELAAALEAGRSEALTTFLSAMANFHHYSFGNVLLIMMQRPDATRVAGFRTWKKLGRFVKKGEKGIGIIAPLVYRKDTSDGDNEGSAIRGFKVAHVFDVSQTDGEPLPEFASVNGDPAHRIDALKLLIESRGIKLSYVETLSLPGALGCSLGGEIRIVTELPPAEEFGVLAHELAHEILHHVPNRPDSKTVRETEAEAVAFIVCRAVGLDTGTHSSDYIQLYRGDRETLSGSLERIQSTATEILAGLEADHSDSEAIAA